MYISAVSAIKLQCGREYGFSEDEKLRDTDLLSLSAEELNAFPTNNISDHDLSRFDRISRVAKNIS